jgi:outer membrane protein OmpA-like peptidoglycan-associated protein
MSPGGSRSLVLALLLATIGVPVLAQAPAMANLRDRPSRPERVDNAPASNLKPAGPTSGLSTAGSASRLGVTSGPKTDFRLAEIPVSRLEVTQGLLRELKAHQTPDQAVVVALPADVLFDFDSADLRADAAPALDRAAELLQGYPKAPVEIHGHTDSKGTDAYNDVLSQKRAQAVAVRLQPKAGGRTLAVRGFGKQRPVAANTLADGGDDPQGRQRNRRVEIVIQPLP